MKRIIGKISVVIIFLVHVIAVSANSLLSDTLVSQKNIVFVGGVNPPYEYYDMDGNLAGFHVDLVKELMQELGIPYEIKLKPWAEARAAVDSGEADVFMGMVYSEERSKKYVFGLPHSYIYMGYTTRNNKKITSLKDLENCEVIVLRSSKGDEILSNVKFHVNIRYVNNLEDAFELLNRGVGDGILCNTIIARSIIEKNDYKFYIFQIKDILPDKYCMASLPVNDDIILVLNNGLQQLKAKGVYGNLYDKWFGIYDGNKVPLWIYYLMSVIFVVLLIIITFFILLKVKVKKATVKIKEQNDNIQNMNDVLTQVNNELSIILRNTDSGYLYLSPDFDIIWENISLCRTFGNSTLFTRLGEKCYTCVGAEELCAKCPVKSSMHSLRMEKIQTSLLFDRPVELTSIPIFNSQKKITGYILKIDDITEHKQMLNELIKAKNVAVESDKLKSAFLANMSHEIRTPLNAIVGFSSLLSTEENSEEKIEYQRIVEANTELLLKLVNDILDLSRIEAGHIKITPKPHDLNKLFQGVFASLQDKIKSNPNVIVELSLPRESCIVNIDHSRVEQVIINYITNAIKHTDSGKIIAGYKVLHGKIKLYVQDTGSGIAPDKIDLLFQRFNKLNEFKQGIGLGLSICKAVIEAMGGEVGVESELGEGSVFWAVIPITHILSREESMLNSLN